MRQGFTLAEVLVSMFLMATVMALMLALLFPSLFMFKAESARSDAQQSAMLLTTKLQRGLLNSSLEWVTISAQPVAIGYREVNSDAPYDPANGTAQWQPCFQIVRFDSTQHKAYQKPWPPGPPDPGAASLDQAYDFTHPALAKLTMADLADICLQPNNQERTLADHVESLVITDQDGDLGTLQPPLKVSATCSVENNGQGRQTVERYQLTISVTPRCQRW